MTNILYWLRVLNFLPGGLNFIKFMGDGIGTLFIDLNLEKVSVVLPVLWNIRNLDMLLESLVKFFELFLKHVPLS